IVPVIWSAIGGSAAFLLGVHADMALPIAGIALALFLVRRTTPEQLPAGRAVSGYRPRDGDRAGDLRSAALGGCAERGPEGMAGEAPRLRHDETRCTSTHSNGRELTEVASRGTARKRTDRSGRDPVNGSLDHGIGVRILASQPQNSFNNKDLQQSEIDPDRLVFGPRCLVPHRLTTTHCQSTG